MDERFSRQSFLGEESGDFFSTAKVAVIGLGGGGSHIVQQLAHVGFKNLVLYDSQTIEDTNLNRLVGATVDDIGAYKVDVAERVILGLLPNASIEKYPVKWQENTDPLKEVDLVFAGIDGFIPRRDLEAFCRRYFIPLIDIGMDVFPVQEGESHRMVGQVITSLPELPCMQCMDFLNPTNLAREGVAYTAAGGNPQVVWPNGVLASTAVGIGVNLLTGWSRAEYIPIYLSYDGNDMTLSRHIRLNYVPKECPHYPLNGGAVGDVVFQVL